MREQYKNLLRLVIIVGAVYLGFRFLLPLFFPFLLAYFLAAVLRKPVHFLRRRLRIKPAIGGAILLAAFMTVAGAGIAYAVKVLLQQFVAFVGNYDGYVAEWDGYMKTACRYFDSVFRLESGSSFTILSNGLDGILLFFQEELIPFLTRNSLKAAVSVTELIASVIVIFVSVLLFLGDMPEPGQRMHGFGDRKEKPVFRFAEQEIKQIKQELSGAGTAYIKTQVILLLLVSTACCLGLLLIKNPYAMLFGIAIGVFDAFPVLGSGFILGPWAILSFVQGKAFAGAVLLTLWGVCQFLREYLEPKLLGEKMGIRPVQSLMAIYIGYELFGLTGLFLGPFGLILIKSLWNVSEETQR